MISFIFTIPNPIWESKILLVDVEWLVEGGVLSLGKRKRYNEVPEEYKDDKDTVIITA